MPVKSKVIRKKAKAKKADRIKKQGQTTVIKPDGTRIVIPIEKPEVMSREDKFIEQWEELIDSGIEVSEDDIPEDLLDVWYDFQEDIKPKIAEKNWALWSAIFIPLILPSYVQGITGKVELPPDAKVPSIATQAPKPERIADYARDYFQNHGLELCKTLSETDLNNLKQQLIANWGKGEEFFKDSFKEDYTDSKARLDTIYRTEFAIAQNHGMIARAQDAGHSYKVWNCALDERSCPECSNLHGMTVSMDDEFPSEEGGLMMPPRHPNCFSADTEVFTENGWKLFKDVDPKERIWTLNLDTKLIELDNQVNQISYPYNGDMIHFKNRTLDCLVTPDHNMVVQKGWDKKFNDRTFKLITANSMADSDLIPRSGKWVGHYTDKVTIGPRSFNSKDFMQFMGWYLSEGSICKPKSGSWQIHISQCKETYKEEILDLCQRMFPKVWNCNGYVCIPHLEDIYEYFTALGHSHEKFLPNELLELSPELLREFLLTFVKGDGSIRKNSWKDHPEWNFKDQLLTSTSSTNLLNNLTEIALKVGLRPNFRTIKPKPITFKNGKTYTANYNQLHIDFGNRPNTGYKKKYSHYEHYNGMVYCLEMSKNHTLYVRRNGKCNWAGNCRCVITSLREDDIDQEGIREDASYLNEVSNFIKFNTNCKDEEKVNSMKFNQTSDPTFPVAPLGMCFQGVETLGNWYSGHDVKYAYRKSPSPGHAWVFVDGAPIDSYYGRVARTREWMFPDKTFDTFAELNQYQHDSTVTWRWTPSQNAAYLEDAASFIKYNTNCKDSEKNGTEHPCSDSQNSESEPYINPNHDQWLYLNQDPLNELQEINPEIASEIIESNKSGDDELYNCMGMVARLIGSKDALDWVDSDEMDEMLSDKAEKVEEAQKGDILVYRDEDGEIEHIGININSEKGLILSKAGSTSIQIDDWDRPQGYDYGSPNEVWRPKMKTNERYLSDVASFIKLNYRCEFNGIDWKCPESQASNQSLPNRMSNAISIISETLKSKQLKSGNPSSIEMRTYDGNLLGSLINERPSDEYKAIT